MAQNKIEVPLNNTINHLLNVKVYKYYFNK
jgi:hypothetical protein